jgi:hypothetical protein
MKSRSLFLAIAAGVIVSGIAALDARAGSEVTLPQALDPGLTTTTITTPGLVVAVSNGNYFVTGSGLTYGAFSYSSTASGTASAFPATSVAVLPFSSGPNSGFTLNAGWSTVTGGILDIAISYTVTAKPGELITDASLGLAGSVTGTGAASVGETLTNSSTGALIGTLTASLPTDTVDMISFSGVQSITVTKDIILNAGADGAASISIVSQGFSVSGTVPEPASMALLGIGVTGLLAFRRLFKRNLVA